MLITPALNINQRSKELRWFVRVGMFPQNKGVVINKYISGIM